MVKEVNFFGSGNGKVEDVVIGADGENAVAGDGDCLGVRLLRIDGVNGGAVEDEIRRLLFDREERESRERAEKLPAIWRSGHKFLCV